MRCEDIIDALNSDKCNLETVIEHISCCDDCALKYKSEIELEIALRRISDEIESIDNVKSTHHTHIWSLDGEHHVLTTHVVVDSQLLKSEFFV